VINEADLYEFLEYFGAQDKILLFLEHIKYGTCESVYKNGKLVGVSRYNISKSGMVGKIIDLFILPEVNGLMVMREMGTSGRKKFHHVKYIKFDREFKDKPRSNLVYKVSSLTKDY
jgi:hypothetical protein